MLATVLHVDDNGINRYTRGKYLRAAGFEVLEAEDAVSGLRLAAERLPDLILLDIRLPDMSGFEVCRRVREQPRTSMIPVVTISAAGTPDEDLPQSLESGAEVYLREPVSRDALVSTLKVLLHARRADLRTAQAEARLTNVLNSSPDVVFRVDADLRMLYVSPAILRRGIAPQDCIGKRLSDAGVPDELLQQFARACATVRSTRESFEYELSFRGRYERVRLVPEFGPTAEVETILGIAEEITAKVELEAQRAAFDRSLRESEERLSLALDGAGMAMWDVDLISGKEVWSRRCYELLGYECGSIEPSADAWLRLVLPEDREQVLATLASARDQRTPYVTEHRIRRADTGEEVWLSAYGRFWYDTEGKPVRFLGVVLDATASKLAERELHERTTILQNLIESTGDLIYVKDTAGRVLIANPAVLKLLGKPAVEIIGKTDLEFVPDPETARRFMENDRRIMDSGGSETFEETLTIGGKPATYISTKSALRDPSGKVIGLVGISADITARAEAEHAVRASEERYRSLANAMPQIVFTSDAGGNIGFVNRKGLDYCGETDVAAWSQEWLKWTHPDDREQTQAAMQSAYAARQPYEIEHRLRRNDGEYRWHLTRGIPAGDRWFGTATDIHDRRRAEDRLAEAQRFTRAVVDAMPSIVYVYDLEKEIPVYVSGQIFSVLGYSPETIAGDRNWQSLIHPEDARAVRAMLNRAVDARDGETLDAEFRVVRADGSWCWLLGRSVVFRRNADGTPIQLLGVVHDITARKRADDELRLANERFTLAARAMNGVVYDWDVKTDKVYRSGGILDLIGFSPDEMPPDSASWSDRIHPEDALEARAQARRAMEAGAPFSIEYRIRHRDGHYIHVWDRAYVMRDDRGRAIRLVGTTSDITQFKETERQLRVATEEHRYYHQVLDALMEYIPEGISIADAPDVNIRRVSRYGQTLMGRKPDEVVNLSVAEHVGRWSIYHADGQTPALAEELPLTRATVRGEVIEDEEWVLEQPSGEKVWLLCNAGPMKDEAGHITGGVLAWRDITARKRAQQELEARERRQHLLADLAVTLGRESDPLQLATAGVTMLARHFSVCRGLFAEIDPSTRTSRVRAVYEAGVPKMPEQYEITIGGDEAAAELSEGRTVVIADTRFDPRSAPYDSKTHQPLNLLSYVAVPLLRDGQCVALLGVGHDRPRDWTLEEVQLVEAVAARTWLSYENLTLLRRMGDALAETSSARAELEQRTVELERSNDELQRFAYVVSHDIQSPLRYASTMGDLLLSRHAAELGDSGRELVEYITGGLRNMSSLIADLLEYSRVSNEPSSSFTELNCNELVDWAVSNLQQQIIESKAIITRDTLPTVVADRQLGRVFQNLIANAMKYRSKRPPAIHVSAECTEDVWHFMVRDNGIGFEMKHAARIFGIFERLHNQAQYEGSGIGLAICKRIVERHGGHIWAESTPGEGSTFRFSLPVRAVRETAG